MYLKLIVLCLAAILMVSAQSATTTAPVKPPVFNFTISKPGNVSEICLKADFSLTFNIRYEANDNGKVVNKTLSAPMDSYNWFNGTCGDSMNTLTIRFWNQWTVVFTYVLSGNKYSLDSLLLNYNVDPQWFPNATAQAQGMKLVNKTELGAFPATKGNSFKCTSKTSIDVEAVDFEFTNYQAQPFFNKDSQNFDTAAECDADMTGTSKWVPIIVGIALGVTVFFVLVAYIIGRRRHRSGYSTVQ